MSKYKYPGPHPSLILGAHLRTARYNEIVTKVGDCAGTKAATKAFFLEGYIKSKELGQAGQGEAEEAAAAFKEGTCGLEENQGGGSQSLVQPRVRGGAGSAPAEVEDREVLALAAFGDEASP